MLFNLHAGMRLPSETDSVGTANAPIGQSSGLFRFRAPARRVQSIRHPASEQTSHRLIVALFAFVLVLPALLSAGHPLAVYGFLACRFVDAVGGSKDGAPGRDVEAFLVSEEQVERYRKDSREDMLDTGGGSLFAITRGHDGSFRQERVRTWNSFLPPVVAEICGAWLDYKEIPYLGDEVTIWLNGGTIIAMGHYHPFGGAPSPGDRLARRFSMTSEVVVSNGLIPFVYLNGRLLGYGDACKLSQDVFRSMRAMEKCFTMAPSEIPVSVSKPSAAIEAFVEYLHTDRHVDTSDKSSVARAVQALCKEFRSDYGEVFNEGYLPSSYGENLDKAYMLWNLSNTELWACSVRTKVILSQQGLN